MMNPLFSKYGNNNQNNSRNNILSQLAQVKNNPGYILDILLQNGKINHQQYNDLQQYRNDPEAIGRYLMNNGKANEIRQAENIANQAK